MRQQQPISGRRKRIRICGEAVYAAADQNFLGLRRRRISEIYIGAAIGVDCVRELLAVGRQVPRTGFPLCVSDPGELPGRDIEKRDVLVAALGVGCDQDRPFHP